MYMNYYCYILFIPMILISSLLIFIMNSWFSMWMIMEINLISFICMLIFDKNLSKDLVMMYFLIQSFNSYIFLMFSIMLNYNFNMFMFEFCMFLMNFSLLVKLGLPPFHLWYLKIMNNMNWMNIFFLSTIQKFIPLIILSILFNLNFNLFLLIFNLLILIFGSFYSCIININSMLMKSIYVYSSIIQISWILILMFLNELYFLNYYLIYMIISMNLLLMFNNFNILNLNDLMIIKFNFKENYFLLMLMLFSLSSIPPFFGFLMKWISIDMMSLKLSFLFIFLMILNSLVSMFFYFRIMFNSLMTYFYSKKINFKFINFHNLYNKKMIYINWFMLYMLMLYEVF